MSDEIIRDIEKGYLKEELPDFGAGDRVKVWVKLREGGKERLQAFEGIVLERSGGGINERFTVRRVISGIGVERTFPIHSPLVDKIDIIKRGKVRRARIYYLRGKIGKAARIKEKR